MKRILVVDDDAHVRGQMSDMDGIEACRCIRCIRGRIAGPFRLKEMLQRMEDALNTGEGP